MRSPERPAAVVVAGLAVCCGGPLLLAGIATAIAAGLLVDAAHLAPVFLGAGAVGAIVLAVARSMRGSTAASCCDPRAEERT